MTDFDRITEQEIRSAVFPEALQLSGAAPVKRYYAQAIDGLRPMHILTFSAAFNWTPVAKTRLLALYNELNTQQELLLLIADSPAFLEDSALSEVIEELSLAESPYFYALSCYAEEGYQTTIDGDQLESLQTILQELRWGGIVFKGPVSGPQPVNIELMKDTCWKCKQAMLTLTGLVFPHRQLAKWDNSNWLYYNHLVALQGLPDRHALAIQAFAKQLRQSQPQITPVDYRYSHTTESSYWAAVCPHCNALRGDFHVEEARMDFLFDPLARQKQDLQYYPFQLEVDRELLRLLAEGLDSFPHTCMMGWIRDYIRS